MKRLPPEQLGSLVDTKVRAAIEYFAERLAHDFNNIITPLIAYPDMLVSLIPDERGVKMVRAMQESAEHALEVTHRLAALAGGGVQEAESFDMRIVAADAVAAVRDQLAHVEQITLSASLDEGGMITMQQEAFVRALEALLENAIRAVGSEAAGGMVTVTSQRVQLDGFVGVGGERIPDGTYYSLAVTDTGPGMTNEDLHFIIEPFVAGFIQGPGCGTGLGLSIAYCGLRRNGAYLQIESNPEDGTRAVIYVPCAASEEGAPRAETALVPKAKKSKAGAPPPRAIEAAPPPVHADPDKQHVLVVDDERAIVNLFKMILENFIPGIVVDGAENGAVAVARFKEGRYPVIVMDLHMPVLDGQSAFFEIRDFCEKNTVPMPSVVICTGYAPQAPFQEALDAESGHLVLNKPVQSDVLVQAVRERLERVASA